MFFGAVPRAALQQVTRVVPFAEWGDVFVGCSGSFRFDRSVHDVHPTVRVHSNDVSLLSCSIGALAAGTPFPLKFTGRLAFIEEAVAGQPFVARVAAVQIAQEMAKYRGRNGFAVAHFAHYQERFPDFLAAAIAHTEKVVGALTIASFHAGDFRDQAVRALEAGGGIAAFPPTYKGDYERLYRFVQQNVEWTEPAYRLWDPAGIEDWIDELRQMRVRYCVLVEHELARHKPSTAYFGGIKPVFTYSDQAASSVRRLPRKAQAFGYTKVDAAALTPRTCVQIVRASGAQMNFLKDVYLKKEIQHTTDMANFLVMLDGNLAGGFIFVRNKFGRGGIYMLCDFSLSPLSRVSKLIIMLATSMTVMAEVEVALVARIDSVYTTAYTTKPVSMKYRGIFELIKRDPGRLFYGSKVRDQPPAGIYADWFQRFVANARHKSPPRLAQAA